MAHFNDVDGDLELDDNLFEFWAGLYDIDEVTSAFANADKINIGNVQTISTIPIISTDDEDATTNLSSTSDEDETIGMVTLIYTYIFKYIYIFIYTYM
jgi:hypothetical protein